MKKIIYHSLYKYGLLRKKDAWVNECYFYEDASTRQIVDSFVEEVDEKLVEYITSENYERQFYYSTRDKGRNYYLYDKVKEIKYDPNKGLLASVKGSRLYQVKIGRSNSQFKMTCSCPVGSHCKHIYAACLKYKDVFEDLLDGYSGFDPVLQEKTREFVSDYEFPNEEILEILEKLQSQDDEELASYIQYVDKNIHSRNKREQIYKAITANRNLKKRCVSIYINGNNALSSQAFIKALNSSREPNPIESYLYNFEYEKLWDYLNQNRRSASFFVMRKCIEKTEVTEERVDDFIRGCATQESDGRFSKLFFDRCDSEQKKKILLSDNFDIAYYYNDIKDFDEETRKKLLPRALFNDERELKLALNNEFAEIEDPKKTAAVLLNMSENISSYGVAKKIGKMFDVLENNDYISRLIHDRNDVYHHRYFYNYNSFIYDSKKIAKINEKAIDDYFDPDFRIEQTSENEYDIQYDLYAPNGKLVYQVKKTISDDSDYLDENYYRITRKQIEDPDDLIANYLVYKIPILHKERYENEIKKVYASIEEAILNKRLDLALKQMNQVSGAYLNRSVELAKERKAGLVYQFNTQRDYYEKNYDLSLKVGIDRYYVVRNIRDFLDRFQREETYSYGKQLTLTHALDNFNETDRRNLQLLLNMNRDYLGSGNEIGINESLFDQLLCNLIGQKITIDGSEYLCRLEEKEYHPIVDQDYRLKFAEDLSNIRFLSLNRKLYLLDQSAKVIDKLKCDRNDLNLYIFVYNNRDLCIERIVDQFKDKIYALYPSQIEIAEEHKKDFKLNQLQINAYFDYADRSIQLRSEYLLNDVPVEEKQIKGGLDLVRKNNYQTYIENLGFENDVMSDDRDVLSFFNMDFSDLKRFCSVYLSDSIQNKKVAMFTPGQIRVTYQNDLMQAFLEDSQYSDSELEEIMKSIKRKKNYVLLSNDRIIDLTSEETKEFFEAVTDIGLNQKKLTVPTSIPIVNSLKAFAYENSCRVDDYLKNMIADIASFKDAKFPVPELNGELRPYQVDAYKWLRVLCKYHMGGILADDMGLGKTIEVISLIASDSSKKPNLIVCPKSLIFNWKNEFARFAPDEKVEEIYGGKQLRSKQIRSISKQKITYVTSYESLNRDADLYDDLKFNYLIIDEAQAIKNVMALKTQSVKNIQAENRFALTGTPIENNMIDLWSIFDFIMPGYFNDLSAFKNNVNNDDFVEKVSKRIAPFILRRTKSAVLKDLPEKYETIRSCEMTSAQRKVYDATKKQAKDKLESGGKAFDVLPYLMRLRQTCVDPSTFVDNYNGGSGKMELLMGLLDEYLQAGHRLLIFSQFVKALNLLEDELKKKGISYYMITGDTDAKKRIEIADSFNNGSKEAVVLISLKAGGTGLNLIGADTVVHLDPWWNSAAEDQASDRSHRIGQTRNVEVIKLICEDSIEQRVIELQNIKKDLIDKLISNDESSVMNASLEDIRFILD
ncbi:MAG: SNF2 helicase associated domain-containing protein [Erysipelotrichaceae bacterium]|nr:SNF2 helicase associated domain-containing protein [Erysipelotrichaceae bacterium]